MSCLLTLLPDLINVLLISVKLVQSGLDEGVGCLHLLDLLHQDFLLFRERFAVLLVLHNVLHRGELVLLQETEAILLALDEVLSILEDVERVTSLALNLFNDATKAELLQEIYVRHSCSAAFLGGR